MSPSHWLVEATSPVHCHYTLRKCRTAIHFWICWAVKDASDAAFELRKSRLLSLATLEGIFKSGQPCRAECDQQAQPSKDAAPELGHSNCLRDVPLCDCRCRYTLAVDTLLIESSHEMWTERTWIKATGELNSVISSIHDSACYPHVAFPRGVRVVNSHAISNYSWRHARSADLDQQSRLMGSTP